MDYYDIQENLSEDNIIESIDKLKILIKKNPDFYDSYSMLSELLEYNGEYNESKKQTIISYERALKLILDKSGKWPDRLEWGFWKTAISSEL